VSKDRKDHPVHKGRRERRDRPDPLVAWARQVLQELAEAQAPRDRRGYVVLPDRLGLSDLAVRPDLPAWTGPPGPRDRQDPPAHHAHPDSR
jgi:hypothetical protein